jgi:putative FmdB family regulatory protein
MPTYEYQCKSCNHRFEIWQKMTDEPLTSCPECSGIIRRILFPAGIVFKGSGFYKTDHGGGAVLSEAKPNEENTTKEAATPKTEGGNEVAASKAEGGNKTATPKAEGETKTRASGEKAKKPASEKKVSVES